MSEWPFSDRFNLVHSSLCDEFHCFLKHETKLVRLTEGPTTGENDSFLRLNSLNRQLKLRLALVSHAVGVLVDGHRVIGIGELRLCAQLVSLLVEHRREVVSKLEIVVDDRWVVH